MNLTVPPGYAFAARFGRLVTAGICDYKYLRDPATTPKDLFQMLRILDWKEYADAKATEAAAQRMKNNARS